MMIADAKDEPSPPPNAMLCARARLGGSKMNAAASAVVRRIRRHPYVAKGRRGAEDRWDAEAELWRSWRCLWQPQSVARRVGTSQHSMKFTASPPSDVSLYFDCMSAPVWRMVT